MTKEYELRKFGKLEIHEIKHCKKLVSVIAIDRRVHLQSAAVNAGQHS